MRPSSVRIPVASATARASPARHPVPEKMRSGASSARVRPGRAPAAPAWRSTGADSPVRADMSSSSDPCDDPGVGADPIALAHQHQVALDEGGGVDLARLAVAHHHHGASG